MKTWVANKRDKNWMCAGPSPQAVEFHRSLDGYKPTKLIEIPELANELGVGQVLAKNEADRLGLPAFKALGASWAIHCALKANEEAGPLCIVTATDGNHGRAVARFSKLFGHKAKIVIPPGVHPTAVQAIIDEGAEITRTSGSYDDAVAAAASIAKLPGHILVQDTAWDGYEEIPARIVEGYATMFREIDEQTEKLGHGIADLVVVPAGVGSLLQGAIQHYRSSKDLLATKIISVEPTSAACVAASIEAGEPKSVPTKTTVMAGLNCGTVSTLAWPYIQLGLDGAISISDEQDLQAARDMAKLGLAVGPCGAAGLASLRELLLGPNGQAHRNELGLTKDSKIVILITEGSDANPVPD